MTLPVRIYPDPILRQKSDLAAYGPEVRAIALSMLTTMYGNRGIGLAAPQVGALLRVFVADVEWPEKGHEESQAYVFINPAIVSVSSSKGIAKEGCLSFPGAPLVKVERHHQVMVHALDLEGEPFQLAAEGLLAVCIQHEYDHLEGITLDRRMGYLDRRALRKKLAKRAR